MKRNIPSKQSGFSLTELALSLGVLAFALTAVMGVIPVGLEATARSGQTVRADVMARDLLSTLRSQPDYQSGVSNFPLPDLVGLGLTENGQSSDTDVFIDENGLLAASADAAQFKADYTIHADPEDANMLYITLTLKWPAAAADPPNAHRITTGIRL